METKAEIEVEDQNLIEKYYFDFVFLYENDKWTQKRQDELCRFMKDDYRWSADPAVFGNLPNDLTQISDVEEEKRKDLLRISSFENLDNDIIELRHIAESYIDGDKNTEETRFINIRINNVYNPYEDFNTKTMEILKGHYVKYFDCIQILIDGCIEKTYQIPKKHLMLFGQVAQNGLRIDPEFTTEKVFLKLFYSLANLNCEISIFDGTESFLYGWKFNSTVFRQLYGLRKDQPELWSVMNNIDDPFFKAANHNLHLHDNLRTDFINGKRLQYFWWEYPLNKDRINVDYFKYYFHSYTLLPIFLHMLNKNSNLANIERLGDNLVSQIVKIITLGLGGSGIFSDFLKRGIYDPRLWLIIVRFYKDFYSLSKKEFDCCNNLIECVDGLTMAISEMGFEIED